MGRTKTGGMLKGYKYTKKRCWYNNGIQETLIFEGDKIPSGYKKGRLKTGNCWNKGLTKYTNNSLAKMSESKRIAPDSYSGTRTDYIKETFTNNDYFIKYWKNHTCKECVDEFNITWDDLHLIIEILNLESPKEHKKILKDYIFDDEFKKHHSTVLKGKNTWSKGRKRTCEEIEKQKQTWKEKTPEQIAVSKQKEYNTRKNNNTLGYHKTVDEEKLEKLLISTFGKSDVEYNYFDVERYPYKCDFYIKSLDLFIELHAGWEHQGHAFDKNSEDDLVVLEELKEKSLKSKYYSNVIYQWTELDVRKLETFLRNNLNFIVGYSVEEIYEIIKDKINKENTVK